MGNDVLKGKQIRLRAMEPGDVELLYEWENDTSVWEVSNTLAPFSKFQLEQFVMTGRQDIYITCQLRLMVDLAGHAGDYTTIGTIDLFDFDPFHLRCGIGILVREPYRRKGFAKEALQIVCRYAFGTLRLHQLFCNISQENTASIRLFRELGFVRCGNRKEWNKTPKGWDNEWMFQKINPDA
jgi:diamine N-acetyltransferase